MMLGSVFPCPFRDKQGGIQLPATPRLATFRLSLQDEWVITALDKSRVLFFNKAGQSYSLETISERCAPGGLPIRETAGYQPALPPVRTQ
jgi:hypothetical protein